VAEVLAGMTGEPAIAASRELKAVTTP